MANVKISELTAKPTDAASTDEFPANSGGTTYKITTAQVTAGLTYASEAQARAGTAEDVVMDPLQVANAIDELAGDVVGPASATDSAVALYDGTTGKQLKDGPTIAAGGSAGLLRADGDGSNLTGISSASVLGSSLNLSGEYATASTASYTADELIVKDSSGNAYLAETVSFTVDITASGVNGLDTGSESSDTWYYVYAIYNGTNTNGLISASATAPTLPSGYTYSALIGAIRNDSSGDFIPFLQRDRKHAVSPHSVFVGTAGVSSLTSVSLTSQVPPIAKLCDGWLGNASTSVTAGVRVASTSTGIGSQGLNAQSSGIVYDGYAIRMTFKDLACPSQTIYWGSVNVGGSTHAMAIIGYTI